MSRTCAISEFRAALKSVDRRSNVTLAVVVAGGCLAAFFYERSPFRHQTIDITAAALVAGFLAYRVVTLTKAKNRIAREFGLECGACGRTPKAIFAEDPYEAGCCPLCGAEYQP